MPIDSRGRDAEGDTHQPERSHSHGNAPHLGAAGPAWVWFVFNEVPPLLTAICRAIAMAAVLSYTTASRPSPRALAQADA
jgi:hypothetical protein